MIPRRTFWQAAALLALSLPTMADQPLKSALNLDIEQARQVQEIQARYRRTFAAKRTERNTNLRKLRRARLENDSKAIAHWESVTSQQLDELRKIRADEDAAIRRLLRPEQNALFDKHIQLRNTMEGSSRDDAELSGSLNRQQAQKP